MNHRSPTRRLQATTLVLLLGATTLTACSETDEPAPGSAAVEEASPAPEASPTEEPEPESPAEVEAQATFRAYVAALNQVGLGGFADPNPVITLLWGDTEFRAIMLADLEDKRNRGIVQTGEQSVHDTVVVEHLAADSGGVELVRLEACLDNSGLDLVAPDGLSILRDDGIDLRAADVTVQRQGENPWTVSTVQWREDPTC